MHRFGRSTERICTMCSWRRCESSALLGTSVHIARARERLRQAAPERTPVLIRGETGTGKERLAAEVHRLSGRVGPYVTLNCAELSPQLMRIFMTCCLERLFLIRHTRQEAVRDCE